MSLARKYSFVDKGGRLILEAIDSAPLNVIRQWIQDVLMGEYPLREGERDESPHTFLQSVYHNLSPVARGAFEDILLNLLADLTQNQNSIWRSNSGEELLLLLPDVFLTSSRSKEPIDLLLYFVDKNKSIPANKDLLWRSLQTILGLKHKPKPEFWKEIYQTCGNDYFGLVFAGLTLIDLGEAFNWLNKQAYQKQAVRALIVRLPWLIEEYGNEIIQDYLLHTVSLLPEFRRDEVVNISREYGIPIVSRIFTKLSKDDIALLAKELKITFPKKINSLTEKIFYIEQKLRERSHEYKNYINPSPDVEMISCISEYILNNNQLSMNFRSFFVEFGKSIKIDLLGNDLELFEMDLAVIESTGIDIKDELLNLPRIDRDNNKEENE